MVKVKGKEDMWYQVTRCDPFSNQSQTFLKVKFGDNVNKKTYSGKLTSFSFSGLIPYCLLSGHFCL